MRVESYTVLHYGVDYLGYSLRSIYDQVGRLKIFYTPHPSHGHRTEAQPPETRQQLLDAAYQYDPQGKIQWYDVNNIWHEGQQRDYAVSVCEHNGAGLIAVVDYDEVWGPATLWAALDYVWRTNTARNWLLNFTGHFWRSFNYICKDENWPVRVIDTRHASGVGYIPRELGPVWHFGYAIRDETLRYKLSIHGHKDELRPNWLEEKWQAWPPPDDCHPTNGKNEDGVGWWNPEPFDKRELPDVLFDHPFFNLERIE